MPTLIHRPFRRSFPWLVALFLSCVVTAGLAQQEADPPGRVAVLSYHQGSVVFAPEGEEDWTDLPRNRPLTVGDRLWTDRGSRAELQLGASTLRVDGESHVGLSALDEQAAQFIVQQGSVSTRVRELVQGENFEIDTPNLALRALQPGDYRVDVDPNGGQTRVTVQSGRAAVFGERGESLQLAAGQQATFVRRDLAQVQGGTFRPDEFDRWVAERNRIEDQSVSARYVPRGVVGYPQLDAYGNWGQDPEFGAVWYPRVTVEDWAPYRYGRWEWIQPWGWTWVDDAPWGFAPFHYGRWTMIGNRWAWVPGSLDPRPLYAPALVVFLGGGAGFSVGSGPGVGWYPLAPGEAWWPTYRTSPRYVAHANRRINLREHSRDNHDHVWRQRPWAVTAVGEDDFRRGRPVYRNRQQIQPQVIGQARIGVAPPRPFTREERDRGRGQGPRLQAVPPRFERDTGIAPAVREQWRAQREQDGLQREAERDTRRQQREAQRQRGEGDPSSQRGQVSPRAEPLRQPDAPPRQPLQIREPQPQVPQERSQQQRLEQQRNQQEQIRQQRIQQQVDRQIQQQQIQQQVQQQQMQQQVQRQQERAQREAQQRLREGEQQRQRADENRGRQLREPPPYQPPAQQAPQVQVQPQVRPQPPAPQIRIQEPRTEREERGTGRVQGNDDGPGRGRRLRD